MIPLVFPSGINWFYETQAISLAEDLTSEGCPTEAVPSQDAGRLRELQGATILVLNAAECALAAERTKVREEFISALKSYSHRVLLNYDSIFSHWFKNQLAVDVDLITAVVDISMAPQTQFPLVRGKPYIWVPETFGQRERSSIRQWSHGRPIPWTMLGHVTPDRAAFLSAANKVLGASGFAFLPPLRPFQLHTGLDQFRVMRVLEHSDLYIWSSHHGYPYHEGLRALHAIMAGAIPAKIDPLGSNHFGHIPWVYPSLRALQERKDQTGLKTMYALAYSFVASRGTIGSNIARVLGQIDPGVSGTRPVSPPTESAK